MQLGFYFDQSRCSGCFTCVVACKDWYDIPAGPIFWRRVTTTEQGQFPNVSVTFLSSSCYHCAEAPCIPACPAGAITKRKDKRLVLMMLSNLRQSQMLKCRSAICVGIDGQRARSLSA